MGAVNGKSQKEKQIVAKGRTKEVKTLFSNDSASSVRHNRVQKSLAKAKVIISLSSLRDCAEKSGRRRRCLINIVLYRRK